MKDTKIWKVITGILAVLVLASILTGGFHFGNKNNVKTNAIDETGIKAGSAVILKDARCIDCDVPALLLSLKQAVPDIEFIEIEYDSKQGKELYDANNIQYLPAVLFDDNIKENAAYTNLERYFEPAGTFLSLRVGSQFDPESEICDNGIDDTGDKLVDCEDLDCKNTLKCREEKENHLQLFIMSDCPYGRQAVEGLKGVVDNFGDDIDYEVHYIANEAGDGFQSLHGQYEVDENIIQLCVKQHSSKQWLDYLYCRSTKGVRDVDWNLCAKETGVDIGAVQKCFDSEGQDLLREDIKLANALQISSSPTWLANNRYKFSGVDAETAKSNICKYNPNLEGCENVLSSDTGGVPLGSC